ncbi:MAG TPA: phosphatidate cytidylyltransferase [Elusimicrobiota bacterium]|nr:phosphatidate cytidylyltransferase [Elusimicrobiota bacterium]
MLLPRVLTAIVGIPLLLFLAHAGGVAFSIFIIGIAALCCYEYALVLRLGGRPVQFVPTVVVGGALAACAALGGPLGLVLTAGVALIALVEMFSKVHSMDRAALTLFGAAFAGWMPAHLALIREMRPHGEAFLAMTFVTVWCMDTAAYAVGKSMGKHPLASVLSPKKTWEGAIGGFAAALLVCALFSRFVLQEALPLPWALAIGAVIGVTGQVSDLAESMVKRDAGIKDSGALLPGHGGVFDRFDSFILCAPAVYYVLSFR